MASHPRRARVHCGGRARVLTRPRRASQVWLSFAQCERDGGGVDAAAAVYEEADGHFAEAGLKVRVMPSPVHHMLITASSIAIAASSPDHHDITTL